MKIFTLITLIACCFSSFAQTLTKCDFNGSQGIESISIISSKSFPYQNKPDTQGHVEIRYTDLSIETLAPLSRIEGSFNQVIFPNNIPSSNIRPHRRNFVFIQSQYLKDVKISFTCGHKNSDIFCSPRGGGSSGAVADFNIAGNNYSFKQDSNPCSFEYL